MQLDPVHTEIQILSKCRSVARLGLCAALQLLMFKKDG